MKYTGNKNLIKNTGLNWEMEIAAMKDTDYIFGVGEKLKGITDDFNPEPYLPTGELQRGREDAMDCSPRSAHNDLETKFNYCVKNGILSVGNIKWLYDQGYMDKNGSVAFSDRFLAMMSNTTPQGNSLIAPHQSIHENGCIPKSILPPPPNFTWAEYHRKSDITQKMIDLGKEFVRRFPTNYERVYDSQFSTMKSIIGTAAYAWNSPVNGVYLRTDNPANHAFIIYKSPIPYKAFDNYLDYDGDWIKQLAKNYKFFPHGYRTILNENIVDKPEEERKKMLPLKREKGTKKVYVLVGTAKYWIVDWKNLEDFVRNFGYVDLQEAQNAVIEVDSLDGYYFAGIIGNISLFDLIFGTGITK